MRRWKEQRKTKGNMAKPMDVENLRPLLKKILQTNQLNPQDVEKERSNIEVSDKGKFVCDFADNHPHIRYHDHTWKSSFSWITFDLRELEIVKRWLMKCKYCYKPCRPTFDVKQLESMFKKAVLFYKGETISQDVNVGYSGRRTFHQPHLPELCEKCDWGRGPRCWTRKYYY